MKIAIQGEPGAFSHEAALRMVPRCTIVPCARSAEVFDRVGRGSVGGAVIPIENSLAGSVAEHFDLLLSRDVFIQSEFPLRIVHNVIAAPGVKFRDLRRVFSHPVALDQCRDFFSRYPQIEPVAFYDTAGSVKHVIENRLGDSAGIAGRQAASVYAGTILKAGIEDDKQNFTRFFLSRKGRRVRPGANKTSLAFSVKNVPGALFKALSVFALRGIDLTKLESRPIPGRSWEYLFYVDLAAARDELTCTRALAHLAEFAPMLRTLGTYTSWKTHEGLLPDPFEVMS